MPMRSTFRPALVLMSGKAVSLVFTFFIPVVLVRVFTPAEFGTYKQVFLLYATLYGVIQLGMAESLYYFIPRSPERAGRYAFNSLLVLAGSGLATLLILTAASGKLSTLLLNNRELEPYLPQLGVYLSLMTACAVLEVVIISLKRFFWASLSYALSDLLRAAFFILPALLTRELRWVLWGGVAFCAFRLGVLLAYLAREYGNSLRPDWRLLKKQWAYASPFALAVVVEIVQANYHQYAVSHYFDAATFAIYSLGCLQIPLVDLLASPAGHVLMVRMSEEAQGGGACQLLVELWHDTIRKLALVFFPLVAVLLITARELFIFLFTETYLGSVPIFMIWSVGIFFFVFQTDAVLRVYAQTRFLLVLNLARLLLVTGSVYILLQAFGLLGAVFVTLLSTAAAKVLSLIRIKELTQTSLAQVLPWRQLAGIALASSAAAVATLAAIRILQVAGPLLLLAAPLLYAGAYFLLLHRFHLLLPGERAALWGWLVWLRRLRVSAVRAEEFEG